MFAPRFTPIASVLIGLICSLATASPRETGFDVPMDDNQFFSMASKEAFAVNERLEKNVDFWVRIDSYYGTNQGLIHDAKYVDIIYEIVNIDDPGSRAGEHQIKRIKKKWHDLLLTLHHKQNHPESLER